MRHRPAKPDDATELDQLSTAKQRSRLESTRLLREGTKRILELQGTEGLQVAGLSFSTQLIAGASGEGDDVIQRLWEDAQFDPLSTVMDSKENQAGGESSGESDDLSEFEESVLEAERRELKRELDVFYSAETVVQRSHEDMAIDQGFRDSCSLLQRLHSHLSLGEILEPSERINRRAQLVRICGDYGKEWVPGTGTTTQIAFLIDEIRAKISKDRLNVVFAHFFRMEYHQVLSIIQRHFVCMCALCCSADCRFFLSPTR